MKKILEFVMIAYVLVVSSASADSFVSQKKEIMKELINLWSSMEGGEATVKIFPKIISFEFEAKKDGKIQKIYLSGDFLYDIQVGVILLNKNFGEDRVVFVESLKDNNWVIEGGKKEMPKDIERNSRYILVASRMLEICDENKGQEEKMSISDSGIVMIFSSLDSKKAENYSLFSHNVKTLAPYILVEKSKNGGEVVGYAEAYNGNCWKKMKE